MTAKKTDHSCLGPVRSGEKSETSGGDEGTFGVMLVTRHIHLSKFIESTEATQHTTRT